MQIADVYTVSTLLTDVKENLELFICNTLTSVMEITALNIL